MSGSTLDAHHLLRAWARTGQVLGLGYPPESVYCRHWRTPDWEAAEEEDRRLDEATFAAVEAAVLGLEPRCREVVVLMYLHRPLLEAEVRRGRWRWAEVGAELRAGWTAVAEAVRSCPG